MRSSDFVMTCLLLIQLDATAVIALRRLFQIAGVAISREVLFQVGVLERRGGGGWGGGIWKVRKSGGRNEMDIICSYCSYSAPL